MLVGLSIAIVGALATSVAFLFEHRGAVAAPKVDIRHPVQALVGLFRSRWFAIGMGVAAAAWFAHVAALALAPLSVVQAVYASGLVFLAVLAERFFGFHIGGRQWLGITLAAGGLAIMALTRGPDTGETGQFALAALIALEGGAFLAAIALIISCSHEDLEDLIPVRNGLLLAAAAGTLYGVANISMKYMTDVAEEGLLQLIDPFTGVAAIAGIVAFYASARALQLGPGVEVIAITSAAANLTAIVGGVLVFRETIGEDAISVIGRVTAFSLVIAGAALMPAPVRAVKNAPAEA